MFFFPHQSFFTLVSKDSFILLARNLFHCMAESLFSLVVSQGSNQGSLAECEKEISYLSSLFIFLSRVLVFRCSQQTFRFSAPILAKVKFPNTNVFFDP